MKRLVTLAAIIGASFVSSGVIAETPKDREADVRKQAQAFFKAFQACDAKAMAQGMHPDALKEFKELMLPVVEAAEKAGKDKSLLRMFKGAKSVKEVAALPAEQFFGSAMQNIFDFPGIKENAKKATFQLISVSFENDNVANVIYKLHLQGQAAQVSKLDAMTFKRVGKEWRCMLEANSRQALENLKKQYEK